MEVFTIFFSPGNVKTQHYSLCKNLTYLLTNSNHCLLLWTVEGVRQDAQLLESKLHSHIALLVSSWCRNYIYCTFSLINTVFAISVLFVFEALGHIRFCKVKFVLQMDNIHSTQ